MTNVLLLTKFDTLGASSRVRCCQYLSHLEIRGLVFDVHPLISNSMLAWKYANSRFSLYDLIRAYLSRISILLRRKNYDVIWIHKEIFPYLPHFLDAIVLNKEARIILDLDDPEFIKYSRLENGIMNLLFRDKYLRIFSKADHIVVGNKYLVEMIDDMGAEYREISVIPSVVDTDIYKPKPKLVTQTKFTIGWMGTVYTQKYMERVIEAVSKSKNAAHIEIVLVGASSDFAEKYGVSCLAWSQEEEVKQLQSFDLGVMPLLDDLWERGKCAYKAIQYMGCGLPVIVSPVGVNTDIVIHGVNGFHAHSVEEWSKYIDKMYCDMQLREQMSKRNRVKVENHYSVGSQVERLAEILSNDMCVTS